MIDFHVFGDILHTKTNKKANQVDRDRQIDIKQYILYTHGTNKQKDAQQFSKQLTKCKWVPEV